MIVRLFIIAVAIGLTTIIPSLDAPATAEPPIIFQSAQPEPQIPAPVPVLEPQPTIDPLAEKRARTEALRASGESCGPHDPQLVLDILLDIGVPKPAAIQQLGSWRSESNFDQCQTRGDGGVAWGLNSWHPGRRQDMPRNLYDQINWAIHTEMPRDCKSCYEEFMSQSDTARIRQAIKRSTRWGLEAGRWAHADRYAELFP